MNPWIIVCRDDTHAAAEAARAVLDAFARAGERDFGLALSGGRIAAVLFDQLVAQARARGLRLADADLFWADERCVPADSTDSNYAGARARLLNPLGTPAERVHRIAGEYPPLEAARLSNVDWERWLERRPLGRARLDVVLLGMGEDGHVASLFPENLAADLAATDAFRAVRGSKPPPDRVTMGYPLLWDTEKLIVLVTGADKQGMLQGSLAGTLGSPLARVLAGRRGRETLVVTPLPVAR